MKKRLLVTAIIILTGINLFFVYWLYRQKQTPAPAPTGQTPIASPIPKQTLNLTGTAKLGKNLTPPKTYCPDEIYLVADTGQTLVDGYTTIQLRSPDSASVGGKDLYAGYLGKPVEIQAGYRSLTNPNDPDDPATWDCFSDPYVLVEQIVSKDRSLVITDKNLLTLTGTVACLPADPDCALGLKTDDGLYFALLNLKPAELLKMGNRLTVSGSRKTDFAYPDKNTRAIVVLEAALAE